MNSNICGAKDWDDIVSITFSSKFLNQPSPVRRRKDGQGRRSRVSAIMMTGPLRYNHQRICWTTTNSKREKFFGSRQKLPQSLWWQVRIHYCNTAFFLGHHNSLSSSSYVSFNNLKNAFIIIKKDKTLIASRGTDLYIDDGGWSPLEKKKSNRSISSIQRKRITHTRWWYTHRSALVEHNRNMGLRHPLCPPIPLRQIQEHRLGCRNQGHRIHDKDSREVSAWTGLHIPRQGYYGLVQLWQRLMSHSWQTSLHSPG